LKEAGFFVSYLANFPKTYIFSYIRTNNILSMKLIFDRTNYIILLIGIAVLFIGFFVMTLDKEPYGFGFVGLTLGPIIVSLGFAIQFVAILYKKKSSEKV
jgi:hypothetical protein